MYGYGEATAKETMRLPKIVKTTNIGKRKVDRIIWGRRFGNVRNRLLARFLRRLRRKRERKRRIVFTLLLLSVMLYLGVIGVYRDVFLSVIEQEEIQTVLERQNDADQTLDVFRISIRLKTGEIIFIHERAKQEDGTVLKFTE